LGGIDHSWALILAAGSGTRLHAMATQAGTPLVPKQFCALHGSVSLLEDTMRRARTVVAPQHISLIVADQHRHWWERIAPPPSPAAIVVQPRDRGTANGILLQLLRVMQIDRDAFLLFLPSDHFVADEAPMSQALAAALAFVQRKPDQIALLGMSPTGADPELGYISCGAQRTATTFAISAFEEKPSVSRAAELVAHGALWSTFIFAARAGTLLRLFERSLPLVLSAMRRALADPIDPYAALEALYENLPNLDFSRHVLGVVDKRVLSAMAVAPCGWSDLGTPERIGQTLSRLVGSCTPATRIAAAHAPLNLADIYTLAALAHRPVAPIAAQR